MPTRNDTSKNTVKGKRKYELKKHEPKPNGKFCQICGGTPAHDYDHIVTGRYDHKCYKRLLIAAIMSFTVLTGLAFMLWK